MILGRWKNKKIKTENSFFHLSIGTRLYYVTDYILLRTPRIAFRSFAEKVSAAFDLERRTPNNISLEWKKSVTTWVPTYNIRTWLIVRLSKAGHRTIRLTTVCHSQRARLGLLTIRLFWFRASTYAKKPAWWIRNDKKTRGLSVNYYHKS